MNYNLHNILYRQGVELLQISLSQCFDIYTFLLLSPSSHTVQYTVGNHVELGDYLFVQMKCTTSTKRFSCQKSYRRCQFKFASDPHPLPDQDYDHPLHDHCHQISHLFCPAGLLNFPAVQCNGRESY